MTLSFLRSLLVLSALGACSGGVAAKGGGSSGGSGGEAGAQFGGEGGAGGESAGGFGGVGGLGGTGGSGGDSTARLRVKDAGDDWGGYEKERMFATVWDPVSSTPLDAAPGTAVIKDGQFEIVFEEIPAGRWEIALFMDRDLDGRCDPDTIDLPFLATDVEVRPPEDFLLLPFPGLGNVAAEACSRFSR